MAVLRVGTVCHCKRKELKKEHVFSKEEKQLPT